MVVVVVVVVEVSTEFRKWQFQKQFGICFSSLTHRLQSEFVKGRAFRKMLLKSSKSTTVQLSILICSLLNGFCNTHEKPLHLLLVLVLFQMTDGTLSVVVCPNWIIVPVPNFSGGIKKNAYIVWCFSFECKKMPPSLISLVNFTEGEVLNCYFNYFVRRDRISDLGDFHVFFFFNPFILS